MDLKSYPLLSALMDRRSRRVGAGMGIPGGPLAFQSKLSACPLTEDEEAAMAFAACGITGSALADLSYAADGGGSIMSGLVGRTIASGDGIQTVSLIVINDDGAWLVRRPQELAVQDLPGLIQLARDGALTELYRRTRVRICDKRPRTPIKPLFNISANSWSAHAPGSTYFLPINDMTLMYLNGIIEIFNEHTAAFPLDERAHFLPAGVGRFAMSKGGHLDDNPHNVRVVTIRMVEQFVTEFVTIEQGMMLQNLSLMAQALGLGGWPNFANHDFAWFEALGFRMEKLRASQYLGTGSAIGFLMGMLGKNPTVPFPIGLERDGQILLRALTPPYFESMGEAVQAVVDLKFGIKGIFRKPGEAADWKNPETVKKSVPPTSQKAIDAATAYAEYVWKRYGRFPAYMPPFRTVLGFQAVHLDPAFYAQYYKPEALASTQREDFKKRGL